MASSNTGETSRQVRIIAESLIRDFGTLIDTSDFTNPDPNERRRNLLTRALAAMVVRDRIGCDNTIAAAAITDGGQDFGIDAVAITAGSPHVWLIQTKWSDQASARLGEVDVLTMEDGLRRIDHKEFARFNNRFQAHVERVKAVWNEPHLRVTLVLAMLRKDLLHDNTLRRLRDLKAQFNVHGAYLAIETLYIDDLWEMLQRTSQPKPIDLTVTVDRWFNLDSPMRAVSGIALATDVAAWHEQHGDRLFAKNIRESLGVTQVNAEIERSLANEPFEFWYRNNGIIMLCDRLYLTPLHRSAPHGPATVEIHGASVVNGAQTVAAIASAVKNAGDTAGQGLVAVRIIESSDEAVSTQITKATNTQNHIERRDFVALDPVQIAIRQEFALSLGLTYAIRRSEFEPSRESGCTVREATVALACAHLDPELAVRASANEDLLWEEGPQGSYEQIFGIQPSAIQIWRSVELMRAVRDALHRSQDEWEGRAKAVAEHGSLIVVHLAFQHLGRDGIDDQDFDWAAVFGQVPEFAADMVNWLVREVDEQFGVTSFIGPTFASSDRVRLLTQRILAGLESGLTAPLLPEGYRPSPRQRTQRRKNTVHLLIDAGRIKEGTQLTYEPVGQPEANAVRSWLAEDPRRGRATWVNDRSKPLVWAADGRRYTPSGLVKRIWTLAEWSSAPVAVQGPSRWHVREDGSLLEMAEAIQRDAELSLEAEESV